MKNLLLIILVLTSFFSFGQIKNAALARTAPEKLPYYRLPPVYYDGVLRRYKAKNPTKRSVKFPVLVIIADGAYYRAIKDTYKK